MNNFQKTKQGFVLQIMIISNLHYSKQSCIKMLRDRLKWLKLFKDRPKLKLSFFEKTGFKSLQKVL